MSKALGIDAGSRFIKYAYINDFEIKDTGIFPSSELDLKFLEKLSEKVDYIGLTGYGRTMIYDEFNSPSINKITELKAAAAGIKFLKQKAKTILDIGGQDTKIVKLRDNLEVDEFIMNDKCAAGTGKFIELALNTINVGIDDVNNYDIKTAKDITLNSTCAVFSDTELIQLQYKGYSKTDMLSAIFKSVVHKIVCPNLDKFMAPIFLIGGTAVFKPLKDWMEKTIIKDIYVPEYYNYINAIGVAFDSLNK